MLFSSITFLYFFLPLALLIYKVVPSGAKNLCLCMISCLFYAWGEPAGLFLMLGQVVFAYILTGIADNRKGTVIGRISYILSVFVPFVFLFYYKYSTFFLHGIMPDMPEITLPIGISFYTFQLVSYCIDVHYGRAARQKKLVNLIAYVTLLPQLLRNGPPIQTANDLFLIQFLHGVPGKAHLHTDALLRHPPPMEWPVQARQTDKLAH